MTDYHRRIRLLGVLLSALLPLSAALAQESKSVEDELRARASAYWQARVDGSENILDFYPPGDRGGGLEGGNVTFREFALQGVELNGETAEVSVRARVDFQVPASFGKLPDSVHNPLIVETWDRVEGVWYKQPIRGGLSRFMKNQRRPEAILGDDATTKVQDPHSKNGEPNG